MTLAQYAAPLIVIGCLLIGILANGRALYRDLRRTDPRPGYIVTPEQRDRLGER